MLSANVSFKVYAEGIKQGYIGGNTGLYVIRHNPFALLSDVAKQHAGRQSGSPAVLAVPHRRGKQEPARVLVRCAGS